jgi:enediyne biosynthesis protein E4
MNEPPSLLRNDLKVKQNWLKVRLEGVKSNRSAIGARVIAHFGGKSQAQALVSQSSYYSCNDPRLHFGLGAEAVADVEVYWPSGLHESYRQLAGNRLVTIREGTGVVPNRGWSR